MKKPQLMSQWLSPHAIKVLAPWLLACGEWHRGLPLNVSVGEEPAQVNANKLSKVKKEWCLKTPLSVIPVLDQSHGIWFWTTGPTRALCVCCAHTRAWFKAGVQKTHSYRHTRPQPRVCPHSYTASVRTVNLNSSSWKCGVWEGSRREGGMKQDMVGSREDMVCWMPMGWRSGMIHSRRWRLRRQRTLAQILSAPHWFLAGVSCCLALGFNCNGQR